MTRWLNHLRSSRKLAFDQAGGYVGLLIVIIGFGFGPSYFLPVLEGSESFTYHFHWHALCMVSWVLVVLIQPVLIRYGRLDLHRKVGKVAYVVFPVMILSILVLTRYQLASADEVYGADLFIPLKDVLLMCTGFTLAIRWKGDIALHARWMIATMLPMIEPSLIRMLFGILSEAVVEYAYFITLAVVDGAVIALVYADRRKKAVRWVFASVLVYLLIVQAIILSEATEAKWMVSLTHWFIEL